MIIAVLVAMFGLAVGLAGAAETAAWLNEGPICQTHPYYHGGTFRGSTERLPRIAEIGVKSNLRPSSLVLCRVLCHLAGRSGQL